MMSRKLLGKVDSCSIGQYGLIFRSCSTREVALSVDMMRLTVETIVDLELPLVLQVGRIIEEKIRALENTVARENLLELALGKFAS
jgi:hypothetical protein